MQGGILSAVSGGKSRTLWGPNTELCTRLRRQCISAQTHQALCPFAGHLELTSALCTQVQSHAESMPEIRDRKPTYLGTIRADEAEDMPTITGNVDVMCVPGLRAKQHPLQSMSASQTHII